MGRFFAIALFIYLFNFSLFALNSLTDEQGNKIFYGVESYSFIKNPDVEKLNKTAKQLSTAEKAEGFDIPVLSDLWNTGRFIVTAFKTMVNLFIFSTIGFPQMLSSPPFNFPIALVLMITSVQIIVYIAGMIEFIRGVSIGA